MNARQASVKIIYNGTDISKDISGDINKFTYSANSENEADTISLEIADPHAKWLRDWKPQKNDTVTASVILKNWYTEGDSYTISCGTYNVDEPGYSGRPRKQKIDAISINNHTSFVSEQRTQTWESITFSKLSSEIASRNGMDIMFESSYDPVISLEQDEKADMKFLAGLCSEYTLNFKVADNQIVIYDSLARASLAPVTSFNESDSDVLDYSFKHSNTDTAYTAVGVVTADQYKYDEYSLSLQGFTDDEQKTRYDKKVLMAAAPSNEGDSAELSSRKAQKDNQKEYTGTLNILANPLLYEGCNITLSSEFGAWAGKWTVDKLKLTLPTCRMNLSIYKVG